MKATAARRKVLAALAAAAVPGVAVLVLAVSSASSAPTAHGSSDPCAASEVAWTIGSVSKQMGDYLDSHPETNQALTTVLQQPAGPQSVGLLKSYFEANPKASGDMTGIAQPLTNLSTQCKLPITIPQALGFAQAAQGGGGLPALPGGLPGAIGAAGAGAPAAAGAGGAAPSTTSPVPAPPKSKTVG